MLFRALGVSSVSNPSRSLKDVGAIVVAPLLIRVVAIVGPLPFVTSGRYFRCNGSSFHWSLSKMWLACTVRLSLIVVSRIGLVFPFPVLECSSLDWSFHILNIFIGGSR